MKLLAISLILIVFADIVTTLYLLVKYPKQVKEVGLLGRIFKSYYGQQIFLGIRIVAVALVIEFTTWGGIAAMQIVTGYAVVNNLLVIRKLNG